MSLHKLRRNTIKNLLSTGAYEEAVQRATDWGFVIGPDGKVSPAPVAAAVPTPLDPVPVPVPVPAPAFTESLTRELWPNTDRAVVVHRPLNKRMLGIELSDGRRVNMWKVGGHSYPIGAKVSVRLYEMVGPEPYYESVA
jgi:hypothetical protein